MGTGARADALGDGDEISDDAAFGNVRSASPTSFEAEGKEKPILREAFKGDMIVEHSEEERENSKEDKKIIGNGGNVGEQDIERLKEAERKTMDEVY
jgi:hypothetical protein